MSKKKKPTDEEKRKLLQGAIRVRLSKEERAQALKHFGISEEDVLHLGEDPTCKDKRPSCRK